MDVALGHILEKVLPREATDIASLTRGKKAIRIEEGKTSLQRELLGKLTGQRLVTINPDKIKNDFSFKLRDLNKARKVYQDNVNSSIAKNMKAESVLSRYEEENNKNYREFVKSKRMLDAIKHFDIDPYDIESLVKENLNNYTKDEKSTFLYSSNEYIPLKISEQKLEQAYKDLNFENINFREFYDAYTVKYLEYSQLPLLEEEKQREKELKRKGFVEGGKVNKNIEFNNVNNWFKNYLNIRQQYFKGEEVSKDFPVTDVKETAADRVDPFTGSPYSDQMARLGLAEGGLAQDILSFIAQARGYEDSSFLKKYADDVKWQESRGAGPTTVQLNNGPARGSYQVEGSEGSSRNETILNRTMKFYEEYPDAPMSDEIRFALKQRGNDLDFSTLSEDTQDTLFYMDAERGTLPLDKLATGELDSKTAWMEHWNQGPDRKVMEDKWDKAQKEKEILLQKQ